MEIQKPLLRGHFHQAMFFISFGACSLLIAGCKESDQFLAATIYSLGIMGIFGVSALYHRINWSPERRRVWRKIDHSAIFIGMAACFTPVGFFALPGDSGPFLLKVVWAVTALGVIKCICFPKVSNKINVILYIVLGNFALPYVKDLFEGLGTFNFSFLLAGGIACIIGGLAYGFKYPKFKPEVFGYHEFFHVLVSLGMALQFVAFRAIILS